jgi:thiol-disulfide isomerase/thioredoxin
MDDPASQHAPPQPPARPDRHPDDLPPFEGERRGMPRGLLWAAALFVVVLAIASWQALSSSGTASGPSEVVRLDNDAPQPTGGGGLTGVDITGKAAPSASFVTFDGQHAELADFAGRPIVINFWSSTCPPCITEMPAFEQVHQRYGDRVTFVGIDTVDGETPARALAAKTGVTYHLGFDPDGAIAKRFGVVNLPTTVLIGRDGTVMSSNFGQRSGDELTRQIEELLKP